MLNYSKHLFVYLFLYTSFVTYFQMKQFFFQKAQCFSTGGRDPLLDFGTYFFVLQNKLKLNHNLDRQMCSKPFLWVVCIQMLRTNGLLWSSINGTFIDKLIKFLCTNVFGIDQNKTKVRIQRVFCENYFLESNIKKYN